MDERQSTPSWHDSVRAAAFEFFEPVAAGQTSRWAGGFGSGPDGTTSLEVFAQIDGSEVSVDTSLLPRTRHASMRRIVAIDLLWHFVIADEAELELPMAITIVGDDRVIDVDGSPVKFEGVRVDGDSGWIGVADHAG